jgi:DNA-binding NarL/FixJ family response regulator
VRVLIADHTGVLAPALGDPDRVIERVADDRRALAAARARPPAVAVVHQGLPALGGLALVARLRELRIPAVAGLESRDPAGAAAALRAGARGVVALDAGPAALSRAIEAVAAGQLFAGPGGREALIALLDVWSPTAGPFEDLSRREREVLARLAQGDATERIARRLGLAPKTVRNHLARITGKLGVQDRTQSARLARTAGLLAGAL